MLSINAGLNLKWRFGGRQSNGFHFIFPQCFLRRSGRPASDRRSFKKSTRDPRREEEERRISQPAPGKAISDNEDRNENNEMVTSSADTQRLITAKNNRAPLHFFTAKFAQCIPPPRHGRRHTSESNICQMPQTHISESVYMRGDPPPPPPRTHTHAHTLPSPLIFFFHFFITTRVLNTTLMSVQYIYSNILELVSRKPREVNSKSIRLTTY